MAGHTATVLGTLLLLLTVAPSFGQSITRDGDLEIIDFSQGRTESSLPHNFIPLNNKKGALFFTVTPASVTYDGVSRYGLYLFNNADNSVWKVDLPTPGFEAPITSYSPDHDPASGSYNADDGWTYFVAKTESKDSRLFRIFETNTSSVEEIAAGVSRAFVIQNYIYYTAWDGDLSMEAPGLYRLDVNDRSMAVIVDDQNGGNPFSTVPQLFGNCYGSLIVTFKDYVYIVYSGNTLAEGIRNNTEFTAASPLVRAAQQCFISSWSSAYPYSPFFVAISPLSNPRIQSTTGHLISYASPAAAEGIRGRFLQSDISEQYLYYMSGGSGAFELFRFDPSTTIHTLHTPIASDCLDAQGVAISEDFDFAVLDTSIVVLFRMQSVVLIVNVPLEPATGNCTTLFNGTATAARLVPQTRGIAIIDRKVMYLVDDGLGHALLKDVKLLDDGSQAEVGRPIEFLNSGTSVFPPVEDHFYKLNLEDKEAILATISSNTYGNELYIIDINTDPTMATLVSDVETQKQSRNYERDDAFGISVFVAPPIPHIVPRSNPGYLGHPGVAHYGVWSTRGPKGQSTDEAIYYFHGIAPEYMNEILFNTDVDTPNFGVQEAIPFTTADEDVILVNRDGYLKWAFFNTTSMIPRQGPTNEQVSSANRYGPSGAVCNGAFHYVSIPEDGSPSGIVQMQPYPAPPVIVRFLSNETKTYLPGLTCIADSILMAVVYDSTAGTYSTSLFDLQNDPTLTAPTPGPVPSAQVRFVLSKPWQNKVVVFYLAHSALGFAEIVEPSPPRLGPFVLGSSCRQFPVSSSAYKTITTNGYVYYAAYNTTISSIGATPVGRLNPNGTCTYFNLEARSISRVDDTANDRIVFITKANQLYEWIDGHDEPRLLLTPTGYTFGVEPVTGINDYYYIGANTPGGQYAILRFNRILGVVDGVKTSDDVVYSKGWLPVNNFVGIATWGESAASQIAYLNASSYAPVAPGGGIVVNTPMNFLTLTPASWSNSFQIQGPINFPGGASFTGVTVDINGNTTIGGTTDLTGSSILTVQSGTTLSVTILQSSQSSAIAVYGTLIVATRLEISEGSTLSVQPGATIFVQGPLIAATASQINLGQGATVIANQIISEASDLRFADGSKLRCSGSTTISNATIHLNFDFSTPQKKRALDAVVLEVDTQPELANVILAPSDPDGEIVTQMQANDGSYVVPVASFSTAGQPFSTVSSDQTQVVTSNAPACKNVQSQVQSGPTSLGILFSFEDQTTPACTPSSPSASPGSGSNFNPDGSPIFETWKIAVIVVVCAVGIAAIITVIIIVKKKQNSSQERARVQSRLRATQL